jgi:hypothetical protein
MVMVMGKGTSERPRSAAGAQSARGCPCTLLENQRHTLILFGIEGPAEMERLIDYLLVVTEESPGNLQRLGLVSCHG